MARPTTEHYGIALYGPAGTADPMAVYTVYNVAMKTIDDILFQLKGLIDALEARMDDAESRLTALEQRMTNAENRITALENRVSEIEGDISSIQQQISTINNNISNLTNTQTAIWNAIRAIVTHTVGGGTVSESNGSISWGTSGSIAVGNMNLYNGSNFIRTTASTSGAPGTNDVRVN